MKVGILTFHDGINHGAYMQAFSTYQFLLQSGYDAEIIHYKNKTHHKNELKTFLITKNPLRLWQNLRKISAFKKDHAAMHLEKLVHDVKEIESRYDAVVIGSDIVWNFKWEFLGQDPIYFGNGFKTTKLVSYAPSFGNVNIDDPIPSFVTEGLAKFSAISVRDNNSASLVEDVTGKRPNLVLDPTFLIDSTPFETSTRVNTDQPYLLVYAYKLQALEIESAIRFARDNNLKIISIGYQNTWADQNIINLGPFEWLSYFKQANYVLTSTFHGTIFSLKYHCNFATSLNDNIKNKTQSLIQHLNLSDRFVENTDVGQVFANEINYETIEDKLIPLITDSQQYLLKALEYEH